MTYWEGQKRTTEIEDRRYVNEFISKPGRKRTLRPVYEFYLLCLQRRFGLLQEIVADLFGISIMSVSRIFNAWIILCLILRKSLFPGTSLPAIFVEIPDVRIVIDVTYFLAKNLVV